MKVHSWMPLVFVLGFGVAYADNTIDTTTKSQHCADYARQASQNTMATTGAGRGAARGAIVGGAVSGNPGGGAAIGAMVGGTRKVIQKNNSYQSYYDQCMSQ
jgi:hypothetical protein